MRAGQATPQRSGISYIWDMERPGEGGGAGGGRASMALLDYSYHSRLFFVSKVIGDKQGKRANLWERLGALGEGLGFALGTPMHRLPGV